jgi:ABC-2 type transport system ATP-binding protein
MIELNGLTKTYGRVRAVDDVTFSAMPGRVTGLVGLNGSGKTTTLRMLLGLSRPTSGTALINKVRFRELSHPARQVGTVLEQGISHPGQSGRAHLMAQALLTGADRARVDPLLEQVGLDGAAQQRTGDYSLGMRQRLAVATALLGDPSVLVLDEPANGLDPEGIAWLRALLRKHAANGGTVLISSHLLPSWPSSSMTWSSSRTEPCGTRRRWSRCTARRPRVCGFAAVIRNACGWRSKRPGVRSTRTGAPSR